MSNVYNIISSGILSTGRLEVMSWVRDCGNIAHDGRCSVQWYRTKVVFPTGSRGMEGQSEASTAHMISRCFCISSSRDENEGRKKNVSCLGPLIPRTSMLTARHATDCATETPLSDST